MILRLRKRHLLLWLVIAVVLPALVMYALLQIPGKDYQGFNLLNEASTLPVLMAGQSDLFKSEIRPLQGDKYQLSIIVVEPITSPGVVVYFGGNTDNPQANYLLGRVSSRGVYYFELANVDDTRANVILYDMIHSKVISSITLK